ncbi:hypothetical protein FQZ97_724760 [compost metagenome]
MLGHEELVAQVHRDQLVEPRLVHAVQVMAHVIGRIVDQHLHRPELAFDLRTGPGNAVHRGQVAAIIAALALALALEALLQSRSAGIVKQCPGERRERSERRCCIPGEIWQSIGGRRQRRDRRQRSIVQPLQVGRKRLGIGDGLLAVGGVSHDRIEIGTGRTPPFDGRRDLRVAINGEDRQRVAAGVDKDRAAGNQRRLPGSADAGNHGAAGRPGYCPCRVRSGHVGSFLSWTAEDVVADADRCVGARGAPVSGAVAAIVVVADVAREGVEPGIARR